MNDFGFVFKSVNFCVMRHCTGVVARSCALSYFGHMSRAHLDCCFMLLCELPRKKAAGVCSRPELY